MANQISIEIDDEAVRRKLADLREQSGDISDALNAVGRTIRTRVDMGFRSGSDPWGMAWSPLRIRNGQPLRDTGRLQRSITYAVGGSPGDQYVDIGTNLKYAPVHQYGATIRAKDAKFLRFLGSNGFIFKKQVVIPARPFLPITPGGDLNLPDSWSDAVMKSLRRHFQRVVEA
jgi:phage gpG-like protein